jgi:hypothetical protein
MRQSLEYIDVEFRLAAPKPIKHGNSSITTNHHYGW